MKSFLLKTVLICILPLALAACGSKLPSPPEAEFLDETAVALTASTVAPARARSYAAMVVDTKSGRILFEENADAPRYPASLTKMMTLFLVFEDLKAKRISLNDQLFVSPEAASRPPAKIGLKAGSTIKLSDAITALSVKSANDVAATVAENLSGSEAAFAMRMTRMARALGMNRTRFVNASGLPDDRQVTTARDMAILGRIIKKRHPRLARYFATRQFSYGGRTFKSTNRLLGKVQGVDGIKTGYIRAAGYNLVASAKRGKKSIIVVVIGGKTGTARNEAVTRLIEKYI